MGRLPPGGGHDDLPTLWPPHALPRATERTKVAMALSSPAVDRRKQLGAFYTPPHLVSALVDWAIRDADDRILEPAAGEAAFLLAALKRLKLLGASDSGSRVVGVEIDAAAAAETRNLLASEGPRSTVLQQDFFEVSPEKTGTFHVALGKLDSARSDVDRRVECRGPAAPDLVRVDDLLELLCRRTGCLQVGCRNRDLDLRRQTP